MSKRTAQKRKGKTYQPKNVRASFLRTHQAFGPLLEWFKEQHQSGETILVNGVPTLIASNGKYVPVWESIEALIDFRNTANDLNIFNVDVSDLEAYKKAVKFDSIVPQSLFEAAHNQLINLRNATQKMRAFDQVRVAETTQIRQLNGVE